MNVVRTGVFLWTAESIANYLGKTAFDVWPIVEPQLNEEEGVVFIFPCVAINDLKALKYDLDTTAMADSIDMSVVVYSRNEQGGEVVTDRWEFGFDDGGQGVFVRIYAKEYFRDEKDLRELLLKIFE